MFSLTDLLVTQGRLFRSPAQFRIPVQIGFPSPVRFKALMVTGSSDRVHPGTY